MDEKKRLITTRSLPKRMAPPAPDPGTRPKPILSNKLKLRPPDIPRERLPKAIDRSGEKKVMLTTHVHLAPKEKIAAVLDEVVTIVQMKPATKGKPRK